jgi:hypothetical protein
MCRVASRRFAVTVSDRAWYCRVDGDRDRSALHSTDFVIVDRRVVPAEGEIADSVGITRGCADTVPSLRGRRGVGAMFTEALVYLPTVYQANTYPLAFLGDHIDEATAPRCVSRWMRAVEGCVEYGCMNVHVCCLSSGRRTTSRVVLANFNSGHKIEPVIFQVWMALLRRFPQAELWLLQVASMTRARCIAVCVGL